MKVLKFTEPFKMLIDEEDYPKISSDEVVVKVHYCGICRSDIELLNGMHPHIVNKNAKYPIIPGHEWSGEIVEVGENVLSFKVGDNVVGDVSLGCGTCHMCRIGKYNLCPDREVIGSYRNRQGAFAQYIRTHKRHIYKVSDDVSMQHAAAIEPASTAAYGVKKAGVKYGDKVLVIGDGAIGLLSVQCANAAGASSVAVIGGCDEKIAIATDTGAKMAIKYNDASLDEKMQQYIDTHLEGELFDVVIETSGNQNGLKQAIKYVRPTGSLGLISFYEGDITLNMNDITTKEIQVNGVLGSLNTFKETLSMIQNNKLNIEPVITRVYDFENVEEAFNSILENKEVNIKALIKMI